MRNNLQEMHIFVCEFFSFFMFKAFRYDMITWHAFILKLEWLYVMWPAIPGIGLCDMTTFLYHDFLSFFSFFWKITSVSLYLTVFFMQVSLQLLSSNKTRVTAVDWLKIAHFTVIRTLWCFFHVQSGQSWPLQILVAILWQLIFNFNEVKD